MKPSQGAWCFLLCLPAVFRSGADTSPIRRDGSPVRTRNPGDLRDPRDAGPVRTRNPGDLRDPRDAGPVRTRNPRDSRGPRATQDDLALLTFGVLQLSDALDRVRETTGARVQALAGPLGTHHTWLAMLGEEGRWADDTRRRARDSLQLLHVRNAQQQSSSSSTSMRSSIVLEEY